MVDEILAFFRVVVHRSDIGFSESEAADVFIEVDEFLEGHAIGRSFVVGGEKFFPIVHFVDVLPAAAGKGLEDGGAADVIEKGVPIDGVGQVVERFGCEVDVTGITFLGQENCFGDGDAEF